MERSKTLKQKGARGKDGLSRTVEEKDDLTKGKAIFKWMVSN